MKEIICVAQVKYTRQEVQMHITALKKIVKEKLIGVRKSTYHKLLADMQRIDRQMLDKETKANINRESGEHIIKGDVTNLFKKTLKLSGLHKIPK